MDTPIAIIFGAGKNIGASTSKAFLALGFRVVRVARAVDESTNTKNEMCIHADLSQTDAVRKVFDKVRGSWGEPSIVFYNAAAVHRAAPEDPFTISVEDFAEDLAINTISVYAATKEAVVSFRALPADSKKTFFYTGNSLAAPNAILPRAFSLGAGKSATAHLVHVGSEAYKESGFSFYLLDERSKDGGPVRGSVNAEAHAEIISKLIEGTAGDVPWYATFTKEEGYCRFE